MGTPLFPRVLLLPRSRKNPQMIDPLQHEFNQLSGNGNLSQLKRNISGMSDYLRADFHQRLPKNSQGPVFDFPW